jgi:intracellular sulfur oxidation DsrE/DsrF family protein
MMTRLRIRNPHKQVFLAVEESRPLQGFFREAQLDARQLFNKMQLAMNAYEFSLGRRRGKLATLGVLIESCVILGLNDAMWRKYQLGRRYNLASTNVYYYAKSNLDLRSSPDDPGGIYQDWSAQAVLKRGGSFMVCHNALAGLANAVAAGSGVAPQTALAEMSGNLMPGFLLVPAGVVAVQLAQEHGWKLFAPA